MDRSWALRLRRRQRLRPPLDRYRGGALLAFGARLAVRGQLGDAAADVRARRRTRRLPLYVSPAPTGIAGVGTRCLTCLRGRTRTGRARTESWRRLSLEGRRAGSTRHRAPAAERRGTTSFRVSDSASKSRGSGTWPRSRIWTVRRERLSRVSLPTHFHNPSRVRARTAAAPLPPRARGCPRAPPPPPLRRKLRLPLRAARHHRPDHRRDLPTSPHISPHLPISCHR